jgi:hypothetical protein
MNILNISLDPYYKLFRFQKVAREVNDWVNFFSEETNFFHMKITKVALAIVVAPGVVADEFITSSINVSVGNCILMCKQWKYMNLQKKMVYVFASIAGCCYVAMLLSTACTIIKTKYFLLLLASCVYKSIELNVFISRFLLRLNGMRDALQQFIYVYYQSITRRSIIFG